MHYHVCEIIAKQFKTKQRLLDFGLRRQAVQSLALSKYLQHTSLTAAHVEAIKACAKLFWARLGNLPPSDILQVTDHVEFFSRQHFSEAMDFRDEVEERLAKLEGSPGRKNGGADGSPEGSVTGAVE